MSPNYRHLFGPLLSRRFGRSLGIDLCPFKTCSYDCVFCQLGRTTELTVERKEFFPVRPVCDEISSWLKDGGHADFITLAGSGEPTLYSRLGEVIDFVQRSTDIPVLVLTNGSLLWQDEVRTAAGKADVVKVSLSCWNQHMFECVNRPARELSFEQVLDGEVAFRREFRNKLIVEVFLLNGINAIEADMRKIAECTEKIEPDVIHFNTVSRPPADDFAFPVSREKMARFSALFNPKAELIEEVKGSPVLSRDIDEGDVLNLVSRRPLTLKQLAETFGVHLNEMSKVTGSLLRNGRIERTVVDGNTYFKTHDL